MLKSSCARVRKDEAQGVLSYQKVTGIFDNPHLVHVKVVPRLPLSPGWSIHCRASPEACGIWMQGILAGKLA